MLFFLSYVYPNCSFSFCRTGMAGVPGTASAIFGAVKDVGANVIMIYGTASAVFCFNVGKNDTRTALKNAVLVPVYTFSDPCTAFKNAVLCFRTDGAFKSAVLGKLWTAFMKTPSIERTTRASTAVLLTYSVLKRR